MLWEVLDDCLIIFCSFCYVKEYEGRDIIFFMRKSVLN